MIEVDDNSKRLDNLFLHSVLKISTKFSGLLQTSTYYITSSIYQALPGQYRLKSSSWPGSGSGRSCLSGGGSGGGNGGGSCSSVMVVC